MTTRNLTENFHPVFSRTAAIAIFLGLLLNACSSATATPDPAILVRQAVKATLAAIPTMTAMPSPTSAPTSTPVSISNLFCEYNFCIGHPQDIYMIDQGSTHQPPVASSYTNGIIFGYSSNLFVELNWTTSAASYNPQTSLRSILTGSESLQGAADTISAGSISAATQSITTVTPLLPYGLVAAWQCGDRDFIWKIYTPEDGTAAGLLKQALEKFKCQGY